MSEQASSRVVRLRYVGTFAHRLTAAGGLFAVDVKHGTEFDCPASFVDAIKRRGTPVEEVVDTPEPELPKGDESSEAEGDEAPAPKAGRKGRQRQRNEPEPPKGDDAG